MKMALTTSYALPYGKARCWGKAGSLAGFGKQGDFL